MKLITDSEGVYHVIFPTRKGTEGDVCLGTKDGAAAHELALEMKVPELEKVSSVIDLSHQVVTQIITGKDLSVSSAVQMWFEQVSASRVLSPTTVHCNHQFLDRWVREMGLEKKPLTAVKSQDVSDYVNRGNEQRTSAVRKLSAIRSFFTWCQEEGILYRNPAGSKLCKVTYDVFKHEEKEKVEKGILTEDEISKLVQTSDSEFWKIAIPLARETGLRLGDIAKLEWSSLKDGRIVVWTDKSNKRVDMELPVSIQSLFHNLRYTDVRFVFPIERAVACDPRRRALLSVQFSRLCEESGVKGRSFHSLRHTNATRLMECGSKIGEVSERLGHGNTKVTQGYIHARTTA